MNNKLIKENMIKKKLLWVLLALCGLIVIVKVASIVLTAVMDFFTPVGYRFELLKDTPVWELAKAVKNEDTDEIRYLIKEKHLDVNYQERKSAWGATLLDLAVGNGKVKSVKALLDNGARIDDSQLDHLCVITIHIRHRLEILKLLLEHGANPNQVQEGYYYLNGDSIPKVMRTPLNGAIDDLACTKLLLDYGADMYYQVNSPKDDFQIKYFNWVGLLELQDDPDYTDRIFVAKYLIVDKQMPIPDPLRYGTCDTGLCPVSALYYLNSVKYFFPGKNKARNEILAYLKKEGFPNHGVVRDGKVIR